MRPITGLEDTMMSIQEHMKNKTRVGNYYSKKMARLMLINKPQTKDLLNLTNETYNNYYPYVK